MSLLKNKVNNTYLISYPILLMVRLATHSENLHTVLGIQPTDSTLVEVPNATRTETNQDYLVESARRFLSLESTIVAEKDG